MEMPKKERNLGADFVRISACYLVLSVHFFLNIGFYGEIMDGARMFIMEFMRTAFMACVPLFLMLSGYLMRTKKLGKRYYARGGRMLAVYLLSSIACIVYKLVVLGTGHPLETILGIFNYTAAPYAWYIEMYIGLFLLAPFLNLLYGALPSKNAKHALIATLLFLTAVPQMVNVYNLLDASWWAHPSSGTNYVQLLPQWWRNLYPVTYYFIGAYLGEYKVRLRPGAGWTALLAVLLANGTYNCWRSAGRKMIWGIWNDWGSLMMLVPSVLLFLLLVNRNNTGRPPAYRKAVALTSDLTLGVYLVSYIFDTEFYRILKERVPETQDRLPYYFLVVPAVFLSSLALSGLLEIIRRLAAKLFGFVKARPAEPRSTGASGTPA